MKIVHLTSVHPSSDTRIFHKECKTLKAAGYEVVLVVPHEQDEMVDGVRIRAVSQPKNRIERMLCTVWQVYRAALVENAQLYHFHDPELIPIALLLKLHGRRVIYDVHEDSPRDILSDYWIPKYMRKPVSVVVELLEAFAARLFDGIIAATPVIAERFPKQKTVLVQNFPIAKELLAVSPLPYWQRPPVIAYIGNITVVRGIYEMVRAMRFLPKDLKAKLVLGGNFTPAELENKVKNIPGWERVEYLGWLSRGQVVDLLSKARLGLVLFHPEPNHIDAQPNKLFEYMSAGIPVVASDFPLWREIVEGTGCGLLVDPLNPRAIAEAVRWILEHPKEAEEMGRRGQRAIYERYNWDNEAPKLLKFYGELLR